MKKFLCLSTMAVCLLLTSSCHQDLRQATGSYTYKTSGLLTLKDGTTYTTLTLNDETGQMDIISLHHGDSILIIQNQLGGSIHTTHAVIEGKQITLTPYQRTVTLSYTSQDSGSLSGLTGNNKETETFSIRVSSQGTLYDTSILFVSQWEGTSLTSSKTIAGTNIQTIAKRND